MRTLLLLLVLVAAHAGDATASLFDRVLRLQHVQEPELDDQAMRTVLTPWWQPPAPR